MEEMRAILFDMNGEKVMQLDHVTPGLSFVVCGLRFVVCGLSSVVCGL